MLQIIPPQQFITSAWKNGGGVTHEIMRKDGADGLIWRISIAEVASDGPFSIFQGLSRILTVIDGNGLDLVTPHEAIKARPLIPVAFSGDTAIDGRLLDGPIRDLNVIYDDRQVEATVVWLRDAITTRIGSHLTGVLALGQGVALNTTSLPAGHFALIHQSDVTLTTGDGVLVITLAMR